MRRRQRDRLDLRLACAFYGAVFAIAWLWRHLWQGASLLFATPEDRSAGLSLAHDLGAGVLAGALVIAASHLYTERFPSGERLGRTLAALIGPLGTPACLLLAFASGIAEEALFRGALQPAVGWAAASLLFGLAHLAPRRDLLPWSVFALLAGLLLGALYAWTGALVAPIVAHVLVNAVNLQRLAGIARRERLEDAG